MLMVRQASLSVALVCCWMIDISLYLVGTLRRGLRGLVVVNVEMYIWSGVSRAELPWLLIRDDVASRRVWRGWKPG